MARMKIFNSMEEEAFESPPVFNTAERIRFFSWGKAVEDLIENLRTPTKKVCFLVMAGYFKACSKFFPGKFRQPDIEYIARHIGVDPDEVYTETYSRETYARHQGVILQYFGYSPFDQGAKASAAREIEALVRVQFRPKLIFLDCIQILIRKKIAFIFDGCVDW